MHVAISLLLILLLPAAFRLQGQVPVETRSSPAAERTDGLPPESIAVDEITADEAIESRIRSILGQLGDYGEVSVHCESGVVTLRGTADTTASKLWATELAQSVQDVVAVRNEMTVVSEINIAKALRVVRTSLQSLWIEFLVRLPLLLVGLAVLVITAVMASATKRLLRRAVEKRRRIRRGLKDLLLQLSTIGIWIAGLLIATVIIFPGMTPAKALTVLGLGSIAIGFAFKDIFENFFAGVLILWRYPFDRGDFIACEDLLGRVEEITIRNTLIRQLDGELAVVPNANLFKNKVDVLTDRPKRRVRIICGVAYGEQVGPSRDVLVSAVRSCKSVLQGEPVEAFAHEFASSSINFEVAWWTGSTPLDVRRSRDEVIEAIKTALDEAAIEIPFPYRTLTFKHPLTLQQDRPPSPGED